MNPEARILFSQQGTKARKCLKRISVHLRVFVPSCELFCFVLLVAFALSPTPLQAQQGSGKPPQMGYLFPAGMQRGTTGEINVGGEFLEGSKELLVSGSGVTATVVKINQPLPGKRMAELREYIEEARKKVMEATGKPPTGKFNQPEAVAVVLKEAGATEDEIKTFLEFRKQQNDPKRQQNLQISETVILKLTVAANAPIGPREVRLMTLSGLSKPLSFCVGNLPEQKKARPMGKTIETAQKVPLPTVLNGQMLPGEVDHYTFQSRRGARVVIAVQARDLIPYLADAVPGWFQPVVVVYDAKGREVAYAKDYRFSPDPVLCYEVPADGVYLLEVKDALYRGREDFVYRITVGEVPFVTGIFPLGGRVGSPSTLTVAGWNLPSPRTFLDANPAEGIRPLAELSNGFVIGDVAFANDTLPEIADKEPNNAPKDAQQVTLPVIANGHIDFPGDVDVFAFSCAEGAKIVAEVTARRLNSPLDSWLKITDASGTQLAFNDDRDDKGSGLLTHQADSYLTFTAPAAGLYYVHLGDAQRKGGPEHSYRLRISAPQPDYALRVVPSSLNARPGSIVLVTLYALRKDGFAGEIVCNLKDAPAGFVLQGGCIPAGQDKVRATLFFPKTAMDKPVSLAMEGHASLEGREIGHAAAPAEDLLQAFIYHHLVTAKELLALVAGPPRFRAPYNLVAGEPVKLLAGGTGQALFSSSGGAANLPQFQLIDPPEGISVAGVSSNPKGITIGFQIDGAKARPGLRGNLIVEGFMEQAPPAGPDGKIPEKKRWSIGLLPAIPFEVIEPPNERGH